MPSNDVGLSPRVRGNPLVRNLYEVLSRSIPARAGEPKERLTPRHRLRVYPRACGGTQAISTDPDALEGLSPRVRGNRVSPHGLGEYRRSIPARAGEPAALTR